MASCLGSLQNNVCTLSIFDDKTKDNQRRHDAFIACSSKWQTIGMTNTDENSVETRQLFDESQPKITQKIRPFLCVSDSLKYTEKKNKNKRGPKTHTNRLVNERPHYIISV